MTCNTPAPQCEPVSSPHARRASWSSSRSRRAMRRPPRRISRPFVAERDGLSSGARALSVVCRPSVAPLSRLSIVCRACSFTSVTSGTALSRSVTLFHASVTLCHSSVVLCRVCHASVKRLSTVCHRSVTAATPLSRVCHALSFLVAPPPRFVARSRTRQICHEIRRGGLDEHNVITLPWHRPRFAAQQQPQLQRGEAQRLSARRRVPQRARPRGGPHML